MVLITESVTFVSGEKQLEGFFVRPEGEGPFPGLVVIHEIFGLTENTKHWAQRFAGEGYATLAVDLFAGRNRAVCMFSMISGMVFRSLNHQGIQDLRITLNFLEGQPGVDRERVGAVGYCMGGSLAIAWACTDNRLKAIAPYYATNPKPQEALKRLCPVVGSYPGKDFTAKPGQQLDMVLDQYGIAHDVKIYLNAKHAFCSEDRPNAYDHDAAEDSWEQVLAFFSEHIQRRAAV